MIKFISVGVMSVLILLWGIPVQAASIFIHGSGFERLENPIEMLITDPQGRRTGYDPAAPISPTNDLPIWMEIPNAGYGIWGLADDSENPTPEGGTPAGREFEIYKPLAGAYALNVIGKTNAAWRVSISAVQDKFENAANFDLMGFSAPGSSETFVLQYSPVPGEPIGIKKIVTFASLTEEIKIARRLNLIKNQGIQTSLLSKLSASQQAKDRNQPKTAGNVLSALLKEVSAQKDKGIDKTAAAIFTESIQALLSELR